MTDALVCVSLVEAALDYADQGWPVFPCRPGQKRPATDRGCKDASTNENLIRWWWSRIPDANVAIATGAPAVDVLDVDVKPDGTGYPALRRLAGAGMLTGASMLVSTPSGGTHVYFAGTDQGNGSLHRHFLDYRGRGGYVLVPPSIIDARGEPDPDRRGWYATVEHRTVDPPVLDWQAVKRLLDPPAVRPVRALAASPDAPTPVWLARRLAETSVPDRSAYFHGTVAACRRAGFTQDQTVAALTPWCEATGKYAGRVAVEVARSWDKIGGTQ